MTPTQRTAALRLADSLHCTLSADLQPVLDETSALLRELAAEPQSEPVAQFKRADNGNYPVLIWRQGYEAKIGDKFYASPPQRQPLTEEQIMVAIKRISFNEMTAFNIARAIEAAHGIGEING